jgi:threonine dehydrogenase-like Zn-dependent dehydrogenase
LQVLNYRGLTDVVVVDLSDSRLDAARALGAIGLRGDDPQLPQQLITHHGSSSFFGMPMPGSTLFFEATGVRAVFEGIVDVAGPGSRICLTGVHKESATVNLVMLLAKEVAIIPAMGYDREFDEVIEMLQSGALDPTVMVTHHFPLSEITAAFAMARDPQNAIKIMIDCQA